VFGSAADGEIDAVTVISIKYAGGGVLRPLDRTQVLIGRVVVPGSATRAPAWILALYPIIR
jgi:hypothetical protein